ncbi:MULTISPECIES: sensor domain-containing diguanylate cyclase [Allobacillus]|uniref:Sensor domain-containing diguanylate cyclase n=1 Tax=Allobacillus salarius TaxID=1955272 RepID=A0A556PTY1_9BACI|nr:sensor domain-containing diguanylate cyclase [Allobacillus salarius]TSJ67838.1 sensor domain-containing diguanylate cyclase [Allobacillus salarius]
MSKKKQLVIWLIWLVVFPTSIFYVYTTFEPTYTGEWADLISFALIMCAVSYFPIQVGTISIFVANGISFAAFLYFGLFAEIILTQLAILTLIYKLRISKDETFRIASNSLMMLITSIGSAAVYYWLGGEHGVLELNTTTESIALVGYIVTGLILNQILLVILNIFFYEQKHMKIGKSLLADIFLTLIVFPLGLVLYLLYIDLKIAAIYFVGIPFILLSIAISLYYNGRRVNHYLRRTSDIGQELSKKLNVKNVLDSFVDEVCKLLPASFIYIYDVSNASQTLTLIRFVKDQQTVKHPEEVMAINSGFIGKVHGQKKAIMFNTRAQLDQFTQNSLPDDVQSVLGVPIIRNEQVVGVLVIGDRSRRAYQDYHLMLMKILANFLSVAIENARHYEQERRKSLHDQLTNLYNYRYLTDHIEQYALDLQAKEIDENLSIIIIDLDSFKSVNDTYGHEAGNEVLVDLARRLEDFISDRGIVARYGGEEFTILVKGMKHEEIYGLAEEIRYLISSKPFVLMKHIEDGQPVAIPITASLGVATYPDHCDSPNELIRQADRAMYVGAKRSGKNKVASIV